jgi:hypothetical protein
MAEGLEVVPVNRAGGTWVPAVEMVYLGGGSAADLAPGVLGDERVPDSSPGVAVPG